MKSPIAVLLALLPCAVLADDTKPVPSGRPHMCLDPYGYEWVRRAARHGEDGSRSTELKFRVATDGSVKDIVVGRSGDDPDADGLAIECVRHWKYKPATKGGQPVELDWAATISFSMDRGAKPTGDAFDIPASNRDNQSCKAMSAGEIEDHWSKASGSGPAAAGGDNDGFECVGFPDSHKTCRTKPGNPLYPTVVEVLALSTGSKVKLAVDVFTTGDCNAILPLKFKDAVPTAR